ncbi:13324_t:CDS:2, partial [Entrophospora sp. SA101]
MKKLIDELYHNAILKQAKNENITMKYVLKGAGGVGKTTTLYTTACAARAAGCLVMYINAKYFTDSTDWINVKVNLFVQRWLEYTENIDLLKKIPSYLPGFISLYDVALKTANDNTGKAIQAFSALITDLRCVKHIPVIICIDQYNSFLVKHKLILEEDKPPQIVQHEYNSIANIFSDWNNFNTSQGAVLYAFTSSSHGSIPQEFMRFFKYWSEYGSEGIDVVKFQYFEDAKRYYTARIHRLLDKESLVSEVPGSWDSSGMVIPDGYYYKLCCPAAEYSILTAFDDFHVKEVIKVLKEDNAMSLRVLELCVQHCFRMAARNVTPIGFPYTDLKTKSKLKKMIVIVKVVVVHDEIPQTLPKFNPGTFYVCWQGAAVIDFFIYSIDGTKIFLQVLELCYIEHHTKLPDLFVNGKNSLGENEYYVYLTTNNSGMKKTTGTYVEQVCLVSDPNVAPSSSNNRRTINSFVDRISSIEQIENEKSFAKLIFQCGLPLSLSEMEPLKNWIKKTRPALKLPSRKKISTTLLDEVYQDTKKDVEKFINDAKFICLILNPDKSTLMVINSSENDNETNATFNNIPIHSTPTNTPVRILGVWFNTSGSRKHHISSFKNTINTFKSLLYPKKLTGEQIKYIINHVLAPKLEY